MFEQEANQYLYGLCTGGTFITASLTGVREDIETGDARVSVLINNDTKEKRISLFKNESGITWSYLSPITDNDSDYTTDDWSYPSYVKRIIAPISLIMDDTGIKMYGWFNLNNLPVVNKNNTIYLYCNVILPEHQAIVDSYQGIITIENKPE